MGANADIVKGIYAAFLRGDVAAVLGAFDSAIEWREAESFLYADRNPYIGPAAIAEGVFQRVVADVDNFSLAPANFIESGDTVVVEGRYRGTMKASGKSVDAQFAHVWSLRGGKVIRFQQYTDTNQWSLALQS